jgi:hypothetical protein
VPGRSEKQEQDNARDKQGEVEPYPEKQPWKHARPADFEDEIVRDDSEALTIDRSGADDPGSAGRAVLLSEGDFVGIDQRIGADAAGGRQKLACQHQDVHACGSGVNGTPVILLLFASWMS